MAQKRIFNTVQSDLLKYNNLECVIIRELSESEYDKDDLGYLMFEIKFENGDIIQAFEDELI